MEGSVSILLGCLSVSRTVSFCFSFGHVARYAPSQKSKTYGTIAENSSQANLYNLPKDKHQKPRQLAAVLLALVQRVAAPPTLP